MRMFPAFLLADSSSRMQLCFASWSLTETSFKLFSFSSSFSWSMATLTRNTKYMCFSHNMNTKTGGCYFMQDHSKSRLTSFSFTWHSLLNFTLRSSNSVRHSLTVSYANKTILKCLILLCQIQYMLKINILH